MLNINFNDLKDQKIPDVWVYKKYLSIKQNFYGQTIVLYSVFNSEKTPSFKIYYSIKEDKYLWNDFSAGKGGDAIYLVKCILEHNSGITFTRAQVIKQLRKEYYAWLKDGNTFVETPINYGSIIAKPLCKYETKHFDLEDLTYFNKFKITLDILKKNNIKALKSFTLGKQLTNGNSIYYKTCKVNYSYGIFNTKDELLKIYNPFETTLKHITLVHKLIGLDRLTMNKTCLIVSSVKDKMTIESMNLDIDLIVLPSETYVIKADEVKYLKNKYEQLFTLLDNDRRGIQTMLFYKTNFNIDFIYIYHGKDISEAVEEFEQEKIKTELIIKIDKKISQLKNDKKVIA